MLITLKIKQLWIEIIGYQCGEIGNIEYLIIGITFLINFGIETIGKESFGISIREIAGSLWTFIERTQIIREENPWLLNISQWA